MVATDNTMEEPMAASEMSIAKGLRGTSAVIKEKFYYLLTDSMVTGALSCGEEVFFTGQMRSPSFNNGKMHAETYRLEVVFFIFKINLASNVIIKRERRCFVDINCLDCRSENLALLKKIAKGSKKIN